MRIFINNRLRFTTLALVLSIAMGAATAAMPGAARAQIMAAGDAPMEIDGVVNIIGFDGVKPNSGGRLTFGNNGIAFVDGKTTGSIPFEAIRSFSIEHSNKGLMRGIKGTLAGFAPQGAGQLYSAIRPGAETVSLLYTDRNHALHGAVLIVPKKRRDDVLDAFARAGLAPGNPAMADAPDVSGRITHHPMAPGERPSVHVTLPDSSAQGLPAAYVAGIYEELNAQLARSGLFERVWRQGDVRANSDALVLTMNISRMKKGNAGVRGAIPVVGMVAGKTLIEADVRLADASGGVLWEQKVKGSKRTPGESMAATRSLAQRVGSALAKVPGFRKGEPSVQVASR
jgi:hypothetical protein